MPREIQRAPTGFIAAAALVFVLACHAAGSQGAIAERYGGRSMIVYLPPHLPAPGTRALVIVLHGGLGNAQRIETAQSESGLNMVTLVGYVKGAIGYVIGKYAIDRSRIFGIGHSNGAMMIQRLMCERNLMAAAVPVSGPLNLDTKSCPAARGKRVLAIHGADDMNVPMGGGRGTVGFSHAVYNAEESTRRVFIDSGASYDLVVVDKADHKLEHIDAALRQTERQTAAEKAVKFFGIGVRTQ